MKRFIPLFFLAAFLVYAVVACKSSPVPTATEPPPHEIPTTSPPTAPPSPTPEPPSPTPELPTATPVPEVPAIEPLPPEPQKVEFHASDGQTLQGTYYPAAVNPAPMVVLMHWAPGDQSDWVEIAYWLQNRGLGGQTEPAEPWLDPSWFPPIPPGWVEQSFAVFTFTFRDCEGGCQAFNQEGWLLDAQAAMEVAQGLDGVDPQRLVALGASIGADGAPDGCYWLNDEYENSCLGALSLSPGDYLTVPYVDAVSELGGEEPPKPDWCLYAEGDGDSARACQSASGDHYRTIQYAGSLHGMMLIQPEVEPNVPPLVLDFLEMVFDLG